MKRMDTFKIIEHDVTYSGLCAGYCISFSFVLFLCMLPLFFLFSCLCFSYFYISCPALFLANPPLALCLAIDSFLFPLFFCFCVPILSIYIPLSLPSALSNSLLFPCFSVFVCLFALLCMRRASALSIYCRKSYCTSYSPSPIIMSNKVITCYKHLQHHSIIIQALRQVVPEVRVQHQWRGALPSLPGTGSEALPRLSRRP